MEVTDILCETWDILTVLTNAQELHLKTKVTPSFAILLVLSCHLMSHAESM